MSKIVFTTIDLRYMVAPIWQAWFGTTFELLTLTVAVSIASLQSLIMKAEQAILSAGVDTKCTLDLSVLR